jgi:hypothetical protein
VNGPLPPHDIPDDTTPRGVLGWIAESMLRSLALRTAALAAMLGILFAAVADDAPTLARVGLVFLGSLSTFALLHSQLAAWPRPRQWTLIVTVLMLSIPACVYLLNT